MPHPTITSERIDDVPLLIHWLLQMHIDQIIDTAVGPPHGNRQGLSSGQLAVVFTAYILTECNHFLSPVRDWVLARRECLSRGLDQPIGETDFTDDRLQDLLDALGVDDIGEQIEEQMGQYLIRAYDLPTDTARIDTTTASVYHQPNGETLLTFGQSKDHRPDLRQFKEVLGILDPAGVPLYSATVGGQRADDPLYLPAWRQLVKVLGRTDFLAVGDCKMASLETRAQIQAGGGWYLAPLPLTGGTPEDLRRWVIKPPTPPLPIRLDTSEEAPPVGWGFEVTVGRTWTDPTTGIHRTWDERVLVVQSTPLADRQKRGLADRLTRAEAALRGVNAKPDADLETLMVKSQAILQRHAVSDYLHVTWTPHMTQTNRYLKRGRHGLKSPFEMVTKTTWSLTLAPQTEAIETFNQMAGWRLYVTNAPTDRLEVAGAVACYRQQWQVERDFHRLKGAPLALRPLLLRSDARIRGLLRILVIALRALTLLEFVARRSLEQQAEPLQGLYPGNPKRATERPTSERLLKAFDGLTLYHCTDGETRWYEITPLFALQQRILRLVGIPASVYAVPGGPLLAGP